MTIKTITNLLFVLTVLNASAQSGYTVEMNIKNEATKSITANETEGKITVYKNIGTKNKITNTFRYQKLGVSYPLEKYDLQDNLRLFNNFENDFEVAHQLNSKTTVSLEVKPTVNFEKDLGISDVTILGGIEVSYAYHPKNTIRAGIKRMTVLGKPEILPTLSFTHQLNEKMFMTIGFPDAQISYSNNSRNTFLLKNSFEGTLYRLDATQTIAPYNNATKISFSQIASTLEYERNMDGNWFMSFKGGYGYNRNYSLTDSNGNSKFNFNSNNGYIFNIGIKYKH
jgi:hypothetical protein